MDMDHITVELRERRLVTLFYGITYETYIHRYIMGRMYYMYY